MLVVNDNPSRLNHWTDFCCQHSPSASISRMCWNLYLCSLPWSYDIYYCVIWEVGKWKEGSACGLPLTWVFTPYFIQEVLILLHLKQTQSLLLCISARTTGVPASLRWDIGKQLCAVLGGAQEEPLEPLPLVSRVLEELNRNTQAYHWVLKIFSLPSLLLRLSSNHWGPVV